MYDKIYLIDSENIGDEWVDILDGMESNDCIYAFYTDRSTHMDCNQVSKLMENGRGRVQFIKCFEGNNALDFQLVSELGAMIGRNEATDYVIVSRDNGYNAVIRYWKQKGITVSKQNGPEEDKPEISGKTELTKGQKDPKKPESLKKPEQSEKGKPNGTKDMFIVELCKSVDVADRSLCYATLVAFEGQEDGAEHYRRLRSMNKTEKAKLEKLRLKDKKQRGIHYLKLLFEQNNLETDSAAAMYDIIEKSPKENKDAYYRQLVAKYGEAEGLSRFQLTKAHYNHVKKL